MLVDGDTEDGGWTDRAQQSQLFGTVPVTVAALLGFRLLLLLAETEGKRRRSDPWILYYTMCVCVCARARIVLSSVQSSLC